ncbi:DUF4393 domain-containing protein [Herbaspirillum camelliae]|uniref:DUF4393 domain-containing protein n=1 Tax=Herbaspirillum camelliae TaxID=1892903 RepID=UPI00094A0BF8|nr:DUF4393 domain-containing protein [Herbaspirillum camelliae]
MDPINTTKLIPTEVLKEAYKDALSPAFKQLGEFGEDVIKTVRLVLFPTQYTATLQDRLAKHLKKSIEQVPQDNRIPPIESLALPIVEQLKYHDDTSLAGQMFVNLLSRAMDKERISEAHPAFVQIIGQLAPDEAVLIRQIGAHKNRPAAYLRPLQKGSNVFLESQRVNLISQSELAHAAAEILLAVAVQPEEMAQPDLLYTYIEHLVSLGLVAYTNQPWEREFRNGKPASFDFWFIELTGIGRLFCKACLPSI